MHPPAISPQSSVSGLSGLPTCMRPCCDGFSIGTDIDDLEWPWTT